MGVPRMIQGQFGALNYSTGIIEPTMTTPTAPTLTFNENPGDYMGVKRHNDQFYLHNNGQPLQTGALHFMTYDYVDPRRS